MHIDIKEIIIQGRDSEEKFALTRITGKVIYATKYIWADTYGSGQLSDGYGKIKIESHTRYFDQIFLRDDRGMEYPLQFTDLNVAVREGHDLTALIKSKSDDGICIAILNHTTQKKYFNDFYIKLFLDIDDFLLEKFKEKCFDHAAHATL